MGVDGGSGSSVAVNPFPTLPLQKRERETSSANGQSPLLAQDAASQACDGG